MNNLFSMLKPNGKKKSQQAQAAASGRASDIGQPYLVKHNIHVGYNPDTGKIEGLPLPWIDWLSQANISKADQSANPKAVIDALKYYAHTRTNPRSDKFMATQADLDTEQRKWESRDDVSSSDDSNRASKEGILSEPTNGNKSESASPGHKTSASAAPTLKVPKQTDALANELSNKLNVVGNQSAGATVDHAKNGNTPDTCDSDKSNATSAGQSPTPQIRRKKNSSNNSRMSEEEVMDNLRKIVNRNNPKDRYQLVKKIGSGASGTVYTAIDTKTQQKVAIKTMDLAQQPKKELIITEIIVMRENQ